LQRQIDELQARPTDRGLVVTLGDVLFTSGQADLKAGAAGNLDKLITFLNEYPNRTVMIEGYTDSVGSEDYNQRLSQRRADSVKTYLVAQGIRSIRLAASGKGEDAPVAGNESADGRQQNRRVEVIINNPPAAALR
jgi:outer membrane protein OmpA-like peptidoglycan-associated protein